jgi:tetratricopeptide (TPR) repeat protein
MLATIVLVSATAVFLAMAQTACKSDARPAADRERSAGMEAYDAARYDEALGHFRKAHELDPGSTAAAPAEFLRCTAIADVTLGRNTPENQKAAREAIAGFLSELAAGSPNSNCMTRIADVEFAIGHMEASKAWAKRALDVDPAGFEAYFDVARIDLSEANQNAVQALTQAGLRDDGQGNRKAPRPVMATIKGQNSGLVEEALRYLFAAVQRKPDYAEALDSIVAAYHRKADLDRDDPEALRQDLNAAGAWGQKAAEAGKRQAQQ